MTAFQPRPRLFPLRPPPLEDELCTSWLIRLAAANRTSLAQLYRVLSPRDHYFEQDLDRKVRPKLLTALEERTGVPTARLADLTLEPWEARLRQYRGDYVGRRWVLPLKFEFRQVHSHGMQYCPDCLAEDDSPHYRRTWRLAFLTVCPVHQRVLLDECPACERAVHIRGTASVSGDAAPDAQSLATCGWCGLDLRELSLTGFDEQALKLERGQYQLSRKTKAVKSLSTILTRRVGHFEERLLLALRDGTYTLGEQVLETLDFMDGLSSLARMLMHPPQLEGWRHAVHKLSHDMPLCGIEARAGMTRFESLRHEERHRIMISLSWLLADWPERFHQVCERAGVSRRQLLGGGALPPAWVTQETDCYSALDRYAHLRPYLPRNKPRAGDG